MEEVFRYTGPVQLITRIASEKSQIGDKQIAKGDRISMNIGSANLDPAQFSDPDRFGIQRNEGRHLGFGFAIHFCLGGRWPEWKGSP